MRALKIMAVAGLCAGVAACGDTTGEQVAIGAAAGTVTSALIGGNLVTGAAVGTAANLIYCKERPGAC